MVILVASCDKNEDIFYPFYHCMEKYWKNHPEIIYATETVKNPYYKTINVDIPLEHWTVRMYKTIEQIDDNKILFMIDDCFLRDYVDLERVKYTEMCAEGNVALFNYEKSWDPNDTMSAYQGFNRRTPGSPFEVSLLCGMWQKRALLKVLDRDCDPWQVECKPNSHGFEYYTNAGKPIIDWGYTTWHPAGLFKGKWMKEVVPFFEKEGIVVDYEKRGFAVIDNNTIL